MPGRLAPEWVAGMDRNGWPEWIGMDGRLASESVADFKRNMQRPAEHAIETLRMAQRRALGHRAVL
jgi:hypothetical protein